MTILSIAMVIIITVALLAFTMRRLITSVLRIVNHLFLETDVGMELLRNGGLLLWGHPERNINQQVHWTPRIIGGRASHPQQL